VEDSELDAELLLRELRRGGYDVACERVENAEAMNAALDAQAWDLVVSDFTLPTFSAFAALAVVRERQLDVPFIIISGTIGEEAAVEGMRGGAHDFIPKHQLARLLPAIQRELREFRTREAHRLGAEALRESERRYRQIIETTNDGVWTLDASSATTFMNSRLHRMLGYAPGELDDVAALELVHPESRATFQKIVGRRETAGIGQAELQLQRKDGTALWVLLDATPILEKGQYHGALAMMVDVSDRKLLEDQLRQSQKMEAIGSLAGGVAHDFNNLLSVITGYTTLLLEGLEPNHPMRSDLEEVQSAATRAATLTGQLLAFSRQQVLEPRVLDLNQIAVNMEKMLHRMVGEDVELALLTEQNLGRIIADPGQIEQVIVNLVVNARDAMPSGGKLTLETASIELDAEYAAVHVGVTPGPYALLAVTDTGEGMSAAVQARIFEPFFTTKDQGKGTGLGLSTVFGIVRQSGGHIWVYSELGNGTTFKVYFPRTEVHPERQSSLPPPPTTLEGSETVLLVEDEEQVRGIFKAILRRSGYAVLDAGSGADALAAGERYAERIDLLLTDLRMPGMSGRELAERLALIRPEMRVLFVSGYTENSILRHGILEPGIAFLSKPITPDALLRKVREVLAQPPKSG